MLVVFQKATKSNGEKTINPLPNPFKRVLRHSKHFCNENYQKEKRNSPSLPNTFFILPTSLFPCSK
jgi:hypothetical protein